jgi:lipopolysaccharide transport system ATP-binding protein
MRAIIKAEHIGKQYRLSSPGVAYSTMREALMNAARRPLRLLRRDGRTPETIWALRDVSFDIMPGEVVGIIGRNGAGKSTLLKILSRVTEPTTGRAELYGRVGSLLEVGTGFHSELSGRENIFLNGSILGMTRREIERKFDEIVAFAEIEKFIDTPLKRYSSGMVVRLAFAVAAHLEPEILVIDEVLAVGDYAFQQKCLNKMEVVSGHGRTVLFVSHNMGAVNRLCQRCILLDQGQIVASGPTASTVQTYLNSSMAERAEYVQASAPEKAVNLLRVALNGPDGQMRNDIAYSEDARVVLDYEVNRAVSGTSVGIGLFTLDGACAFISGDFDAHPDLLGVRDPGQYRTEVAFPSHWLNTGRYRLTVYIANAMSGVVYDQIEAIVFNVLDTGTPGSLHGVKRQGVLQPILEWTTTRTAG